MAVARRLAAEHPAVPARFLTAGEPHFVNAKVKTKTRSDGSSRAGMKSLVISDSDVHVEPDYLREVVSPLLPAGAEIPGWR